MATSAQSGVQVKRLHRIAYGEEPETLRVGEVKELRDAATEFLRRRGLLGVFRGRRGNRRGAEARR